MSMCLNCELFNCVGCDSLDAMPEYGCCCGSIRPDPDPYDDGDYVEDGDAS